MLVSSSHDVGVCLFAPRNVHRRMREQSRLSVSTISFVSFLLVTSLLSVRVTGIVRPRVMLQATEPHQAAPSYKY